METSRLIKTQFSISPNDIKAMSKCLNHPPTLTNSNSSNSKELISSSLIEVEVVFADYEKNISNDEDLVFYYETSWCFENLFYQVEVSLVTINGVEKTLNDLKRILYLPLEDYDLDVWAFNPRATFSIVKSVN